MRRAGSLELLKGEDVSALKLYKQVILEIAMDFEPLQA